jgi:hypothetical protein
MSFIILLIVPLILGNSNETTFGNYTNGIHLNKSSLIGIQISKACISIEMNDIKSNCLTYDKIKQFDTTNTNYAGKWINDTWYHRGTPHTKQTWAFINSNVTVMVDPDSDFTTQAKMIIIQGNNFTYIDPNQVVSNHIRNEYHNRFVYSDCSSAMIAPNVWLLNDTIQYLKSGCKTTSYHEITNSTTPSYKAHYDTMTVQGINWMKHFSNVTRTYECIITKCDISSNPWHNHDSRFDW